MLHIGHWYAFAVPGRLRALAAHARLQRALPDGLRCLRPAGGERRHPAQHPPRHLDLRQHRRHAPAVSPDGGDDRLDPRGHHLHSRVLPLEPVVLPADAGARPGLPGQGRGLVVSEGPDRAGQRAGAGGEHLRALRRRGLSSATWSSGTSASPTTPRSCCTSSRSSTGPNASRRCSATGSAAPKGARLRFKLETGDALEVFTTRPDTVWGATFMVLAPEHPLVAKITTADRQAESRRTSSRRDGRPRSSGCRPTRPSPKTGVFTGGYAINPVTDERIPIWIADYVLDGLRHRRDHGGALGDRARLRVCARLRSADPRRRPAGRRAMSWTRRR